MILAQLVTFSAFILKWTGNLFTGYYKSGMRPQSCQGLNLRPLSHSPSPEHTLCLYTWSSWTAPHQNVDLDLQSAGETSNTEVVL